MQDLIDSYNKSARMVLERSHQLKRMLRDQPISESERFCLQQRIDLLLYEYRDLRLAIAAMTRGCHWV